MLLLLFILVISVSSQQTVWNEWGTSKYLAYRGRKLTIRILRHLLQYSPLIAEGTRKQLLNIPQSAGRQALITALESSSIHFPLSQFPHLLSGAITFPVPVFTIWGLIEDIRVLEKFRTNEYEVKNLNVIDEASSRLLEVGGLKLRIFGLGGVVSMHKLCKSLSFFFCGGEPKLTSS
jgi:hypothetical protein